LCFLPFICSCNCNYNQRLGRIIAFEQQQITYTYTQATRYIRQVADVGSGELRLRTNEYASERFRASERGYRARLFVCVLGRKGTAAAVSTGARSARVAVATTEDAALCGRVLQPWRPTAEDASEASTDEVRVGEKGGREGEGKDTHKLALIPCGIKVEILRRGQVESCQSFGLKQLPLLLLNWQGQ
jgi:hypothetical protein